jgi:hypothetical protein
MARSVDAVQDRFNRRVVNRITGVRICRAADHSSSTAADDHRLTTSHDGSRLFINVHRQSPPLIAIHLVSVSGNRQHER